MILLQLADDEEQITLKKITINDVKYYCSSFLEDWLEPSFEHKIDFFFLRDILYFLKKQQKMIFDYEQKLNYNHAEPANILLCMDQGKSTTAFCSGGEIYISVFLLKHILEETSKIYRNPDSLKSPFFNEGYTVNNFIVNTCFFASLYVTLHEQYHIWHRHNSITEQSDIITHQTLEMDADICAVRMMTMHILTTCKGADRMDDVPLDIGAMIAGVFVVLHIFEDFSVTDPTIFETLPEKISNRMHPAPTVRQFYLEEAIYQYLAPWFSHEEMDRIFTIWNEISWKHLIQYEGASFTGFVNAFVAMTEMGQKHIFP